MKPEVDTKEEEKKVEQEVVEEEKSPLPSEHDDIAEAGNEHDISAITVKN